jgi:deazaflavin-dependent oxidoreductase (nitroreductase family)
LIAGLVLESSPEMITHDYEDAGRFRRAVLRTAATRPMTRLYSHIQQPTDTLVYRLSRGRTTLSSWLAGLPLVMLTTTGARSGLPRTSPVLGLRDGDAIVVIASNYGRPHHPGWYHNLRAHPQARVAVAGVTRTVEARELVGAEWDRCFQRAVAIYPGFECYRRWAGRPIPVLRLEQQ